MKEKRKVIIICGVIVLLITCAALCLMLLSPKGEAAGSIDRKDFLQIELKGNKAGSPKASNIFAVRYTQGEIEGVDALLRNMGQNGLKFYKSSKDSATSGAAGLISPDDVVLIEINCQWDYRGGTNTDLVKSVIQKIVNHPDGFKGEIIIADNGQGQYGGEGRGGSMDWKMNNARDRSQSIQKVAETFSKDYRVSAVLWDNITDKAVREYSEGNMDDGFIIDSKANASTGVIVSYPKFKTKYGTYVSFKEGIWDNSIKKYDSNKLKVISMPVLKNHSQYNVTACIKKYMGVTSDKLTNHNAHNSIGKGGMGTEMAETRVPVINILDAIWVNPFRGPATTDKSAVNTGIIAAGTDPAAMDFWAAKCVLIEAAKKSGNYNTEAMDPEDTTPGHFGQWLKLSADELIKAGHPAVLGMDNINVYLTER